MGNDNITKLASLLVKLHRAPSSWLCIHPRPDRASSGVGNNQRKIKLVRSDGSLEVYDRPMVVSELTKDFPKHKICRSDLLYIGQKTPVLSETDTLKLGLSYFLLPSDFFNNDLSFLTIAALKTPKNGGVLVKKSNQQQPQPFLIQKGEKGERLKIRVSEDFMSELMMEGKKNRANEEEDEEEEESNVGRVCTTVKLKKDYLQLVGLRKWKPKLETITETKAMKSTTMEKTKKKRKRFTVMKKKSQSDSSAKPVMKKKSQTDSSAKRKLQSKFKSKTKKTILKKI